MSYQSIDELQKVLSEKVFYYAKDSKKAAGRALGTLLEIITFYLIKSWEFEHSIAIEKRLPEYANPDITHNVEFSLHPLIFPTSVTFPLTPALLPLTSSKIVQHQNIRKFRLDTQYLKTNRLLTKDSILKNACTIYEDDNFFYNAYLSQMDSQKCVCDITKLWKKPYAMIECKRVGVEEGMKTGPQTIEKAKQGAYVARSVSALQKVQMQSGKVGGFIELENGQIVIQDYLELMDKVIKSNSPQLLKNFILTVGIVSDHGNWFTSGNLNKELKVLAQSYDWLLFLTDAGIAQFIDDLLLSPEERFKAAKDSFLSSYTGERGCNEFTKASISLKAHIALQTYFNENLPKIESWFNIITPLNKNINILKTEINMLKNKNWKDILS